MKLSISKNVHLVEPGDFEPTDHWYPRVLNSNIHPLVSYFLNLTHEQMTERYHRLNPMADKEAILEILKYQPVYFRWAGTDLMHVTNHEGNRKLTVIETNSCPSGQKSMPLLDLNVEQGGYKRLIEKTFKPMVDAHQEEGALAVIYDKNPMENIGYAATIADAFGENVYLAKFEKSDNTPPVKFVDGKMYVKNEMENWEEIRAAFRYVTQEPWNRLPKNPKTLILNPIEACLAGGRNKEVASSAYDIFNEKFKDKGISIFTPKTFTKVPYEELRKYFGILGGSMVIKVPDSNAGQGVYTVVNEEELEFALSEISKSDLYLVQQLIHSNYSDGLDPSKAWYHVGTIPDFKGRSYAFDLRLMMHATDEGIRPLAVYSRRSGFPLNEELPKGKNSWEVYGTNLSIKGEDGWTYADERLMLFDIRNFGQLGLGIDELIKGFVQSAMAVYAIDQNAILTFGEKNANV
ncbi:hypothetical protein A33Q_3498 [Indibacter alkaliphilus LW1]|uniref:Uncharacterized protein n=1 Tax=Indibacter alkaliphilus (strain CCUG 57479 / KCTC 22604 / LW1) TaxID=1189612 RepID=S2DNQ1_INDAL|nr:hypothetical protein [Indibacter alkaliphilus]EOZ93546.1 hypothetical protein A33Q_3492 [Indibacter alkaliphilus LW1]EOZ93552.1 hypothetical protein A33Q_3498 [Indibacter alkaliphilus LW1]